MSEDELNNESYFGVLEDEELDNDNLINELQDIELNSPELNKQKKVEEELDELAESDKKVDNDVKKDIKVIEEFFEKEAKEEIKKNQEEVKEEVKEKSKEELKILPDKEDRFGFTNKEYDYIGTLAKNRRFNMDAKTILYPKTYEEQLNYFLKSMRFIFTIKNQIDKDKNELYEKINNIFEENKELEEKCMNLLRKLDEDIEFGKSQIKYKLYILFLNNRHNIFNLIDFVYPLGKRIRTVDISDTPAYY